MKEVADELKMPANGPAENLNVASPDMVRRLLAQLMRREHLTRLEAAQLLDAFLSGNATDAQIAAALIALALKTETVEELVGMAETMRSRAKRIKTTHARFIDTAGTGTSAVKTFNVSTAAAFVIAGAGLPVAKHGSRAVTSNSGSADALTALGVGITSSPEVSENCLNEIGICFMFAPLYHEATARVAGVRRELGTRTAFNLLGPLTNPAGAPCQIIGVWDASLVEPLAHALAALECERAWVVHGLDGLDEVTLAAPTRVAEVHHGNTRVFDVAPEDFGFKTSRLDRTRVDSAAASAEIIRAVLSGARRDEARDLVLINAAAALFVGGITDDFKEAARLAEASIDSGAAHGKLEALVRATNR